LGEIAQQFCAFISAKVKYIMKTKIYLLLFIGMCYSCSPTQKDIRGIYVSTFGENNFDTLKWLATERMRKVYIEYMIRALYIAIRLIGNLMMAG